MCGSGNLQFLELMAQSFVQDDNLYIAAPQSSCMFNTHSPPLVTATLDMSNMVGRDYLETLHYLGIVKLNNACSILCDSLLKTMRTLKVLQNIW